MLDRYGVAIRVGDRVRYAGKWDGVVTGYVEDEVVGGGVEVSVAFDGEYVIQRHLPGDLVVIDMVKR